MMLPALLAAVVIGGGDFEVRALDGSVAAGQLRELNDRQLVIETEHGAAAFPLDSLAAASRREAPTSQQKAALWVELVDGSRLAAAEYAVRGSSAQVRLAVGSRLDIPAKAIRSVRFDPTPDADAKLAKQWKDVIEVPTAGDLLVVRKNGVLDYLEGISRDVDTETCQFEIDQERVPVKRAKVEGIIYARPATELPEPLGLAVFADGTSLALRNMAAADSSLRLTTPAGIEVSLDLNQVTRFDFSTGKIAYLSDLEPQRAQFVPLVGFKEDLAAVTEFYRFRRDIGFGESPLRLDGKTFRKGLALASRTTLSYKLPGKFRLFKTTVGIDDSTRDVGNVRLVIQGDGKTLWEGEVRGSEPARNLEIEIAGIKRMEIVVDYGDDLDIGDRLDLGDARVTK
ncbi:MAG TPA: NPCBM/NEW2 domain-containing protein [Pirellulales bacterium]|nr:NPCBM/NEW2 domain-containing protein [Pirellulales bacterium]